MSGFEKEQAAIRQGNFLIRRSGNRGRSSQSSSLFKRMLLMSQIRLVPVCLCGTKAPSISPPCSISVHVVDKRLHRIFESTIFPSVRGLPRRENMSGAGSWASSSRRVLSTVGTRSWLLQFLAGSHQTSAKRHQLHALKIARPQAGLSLYSKGRRFGG